MLFTLTRHIFGGKLYWKWLIWLSSNLSSIKRLINARNWKAYSGCYDLDIKDIGEYSGWFSNRPFVYRYLPLKHLFWSWSRKWCWLCSLRCSHSLRIMQMDITLIGTTDLPLTRAIYLDVDLKRLEDWKISPKYLQLHIGARSRVSAILLRYLGLHWR